MNTKDVEQTGMFRLYLLEKAERSRSRLIKDQIRCWVERLDEVRKSEGDEPLERHRELRRAA